MFKVTNMFEDERKFYDGQLGRDVIIEPGKSVLTSRPPKNGNVFKVEVVKEKENKEVKENDRSSS